MLRVYRIRCRDGVVMAWYQYVGETWTLVDHLTVFLSYN